MTRYQPEDTGKSYATEANAIKAAEAKFGKTSLTYIVMPVDVKGAQRFVPVFIGERALQAGAHWSFHVLG